MSDDNLARTIAALREQVTPGSVCVFHVESATRGFVLESGLFGALLDAAEAGLRCPPREPDRMMTAAGINALRVTGGDIVDDVRATWRAMYDAAPINEGGRDGVARKDAEIARLTTELAEAQAERCGFVAEAK